MAVPKKKTSKSKSRSRRASNWVLRGPSRSVCPQCSHGQAPARRLSELRLVQGTPGDRRRIVPRAARPTGEALTALPVAVDAMGGDNAPDEIVAGARRVAEEKGISVVLVGLPDAAGRRRRAGRSSPPPRSSAWRTTRRSGVRRKKDSSLVRAAEAVRDGRAMAMVSAGNTGATMAAALLRMGRLPGVLRPAIATPVPDLNRPWPTVLLDSGANAECSAPMLVQFAQMGAAYARTRYGVDRPRVALLSIGEEKSKGTPLVKETHAILADEGRWGEFRLRGQRRGPQLLR